MDPGQRDNMDRWIVYRPDSSRVRNMLRESYGKAALEVAEKVWADGRAIVISRKKRVPLAERLAWTEGDPEWNKKAWHKGLRLGCAQTWIGTDFEQQKAIFPWIEMPSLETLKAQYNHHLPSPDPSDDEAETEEPTAKRAKK